MNQLIRGYHASLDQIDDQKGECCKDCLTMSDYIGPHCGKEYRYCLNPECPHFINKKKN